MSTPGLTSRDRRRRGAVLLEFALIALPIFLVAGAALELGRGFLYAQVAQSAAEVGARELALLPLPATIDFDTALSLPIVRQRVFDPTRLVLDLDDLDDPGTPEVETTLDEAFAVLPALNRALRPVMIVDTPVLDGVARRLLRYPGALLADASAPLGLVVQIPLVTERDADTGVETAVEWLRVVEEARPDRLDPSSGRFALDVPGGGLIALRVNVPYQAAAMSGHRTPAAGPGEPNVLDAIPADDDAIVASSMPLDGATYITSLDTLDVDQPGPRAFAGRAGLGSLFALDRSVRPFRRLIGAQALARREVVTP